MGLMIWGVEGRHLWIPPSAAVGIDTPAEVAALIAAPPAGSILFRKTDDDGEDVFPRYRLHPPISGLKGVGDSGANSDPRVRGEGEIPRRSFRRGKTIAYSGTIEALTHPDLGTAEEAMSTAFSDQSADGLMIVYPHPIYDPSGDFRYFNARSLTCEIDEIFASPRRRTRGHESAFVVSIRNARAGGVSYRDQAGVTYS